MHCPKQNCASAQFGGIGRLSPVTSIKTHVIVLTLALFVPLLSIFSVGGSAATADWSTFSDYQDFQVSYPSDWVPDPANQLRDKYQVSLGFSSDLVDPVIGGVMGTAPDGAYLLISVDSPFSGTTIDEHMQQFRGSQISTLPSRDLYGVSNVVLISDFTQVANAEPIISLNLLAEQAGRVYQVMCAARSRADFARWRSTCDAIIDSFTIRNLYFPETNVWVGGNFLTYWEEFGGLPIFGYPVMYAGEENGVTEQYFERARFELHPGAWPERHDVLLGRLGDELLPTHIPDFTPYPFEFTPPSGQSGCRFFPNQHDASMGFNVCNGFRAYWEQYGGLAVFGYPLSQEYVDPRTGVVTQYFERARFEWHPGAWPERYDVLLGRLGAEWIAANVTPVAMP